MHTVLEDTTHPVCITIVLSQFFHMKVAAYNLAELTYMYHDFMYKYKYGTFALFMFKHFIPHSYAMTPHKSSHKRRNSMQLWAFRLSPQYGDSSFCIRSLVSDMLLFFIPKENIHNVS